MVHRRGVTRPTVAAIIVVSSVVLALTVACGRTDTAGPGTTAVAATAPGTSPGTSAVGTTAPPTTEPPTTAPPAETTTPPPTPPSGPRPTVVKRERPPAPAPNRLQPPADLALAGPPVVDGEGMWSPVGAPVAGAPALYTTTVRSDAAGAWTSTVLWIDTSATTLGLIPGTDEPGGTWPEAGSVPAEERGGLLAAFNSGFLAREAQGAFYLRGQNVNDFAPGIGSVVIDDAGKVSIGVWGRDVDMNEHVVGVRQNLPLLVDEGKVAPNATDTDTKVWGRTLGSIAAPWRSAIGIRGDGGLLYVAGPGLTVRALGSVLVAAGSVRAMVLDLNPEWVTCNIFTPSAPGMAPQKCHPLQAKPATRYLGTDMRDFFAVLARPKA